MKRTPKILSLLGLLFFTMGCVHENNDKCPVKTDHRNVSLEFSLRDGNGRDVFESNISSVELGIYNDQGKLVATIHISKVELIEFQGIKLELDPGLYHIAGWGNVGENTQYKGVDIPHPYGPHITYNNINSGRTTDADKVFYAPKTGLGQSSGLSGTYRMTVDPVTGHTGILEFTAAYRTIKVYVEGYNGIPEVELHNLPEGLTWFGGMTWLADSFGSKPLLTASRTTTPEEKEGVRYDYAAFDTFNFDADNDIILNVADNSTHESAYTVTLNEMFEGIGFPTGITISVVVRFTPAGVEVGIPKWENHEVDPELGV